MRTSRSPIPRPKVEHLPDLQVIEQASRIRETLVLVALPPNAGRTQAERLTDQALRDPAPARVAHNQPTLTCRTYISSQRLRFAFWFQSLAKRPSPKRK